jgi:hypothetical protein
VKPTSIHIASKYFGKEEDGFRRMRLYGLVDKVMKGQVVRGHFAQFLFASQILDPLTICSLLEELDDAAR